MPIVTEVDFFSNGCAKLQEYDMLNLWRHEDDFGIDATWVLFATSHGKSPCDGIGGTVKRLTARASLQRSYSDQILDVSSMLAFCKTNIPSIQFCYISIEKMKEVWLELKFALDQDCTRNKKLPFLQTSKFQCINTYSRRWCTCGFI